jgi:hypothetical protein
MTDKPHLYPDRPGNWYVIDGKLVDVPVGEEEKYLKQNNKKEDGRKAAPAPAVTED